MSKSKRNEIRKLKVDKAKKREILRLKKMLGMIDDQGNEIMKKIDDIATVKDAKTMRRRKKKEVILEPHEQVAVYEIQDKLDKGETVKVVNESTNVEHVYNTKTMRDQFGTLPDWMNQRNSRKRMNRRKGFRQKKYDPFWAPHVLLE